MNAVASGANRRQAETQERLRAVKIAVVASFLVCIVELAVGWALNLGCLVAEGVHTLIDGVDSVIVLSAVFMAARPADRSHQFGHGKYEALGATVEGSLVFAAAIGIAYQAFVRLLHGEAPERIPLYVCLVMGVVAVFYLFLSIYLMRLAGRTRSPAILAEALHLRSHIFITGGLAGGLLLGRLGDWPVADTFLAIGVAACLMWISIRIFRQVLGQFTDAALPAVEIETLGTIIDRFNDRFTEVHGLRTRQSGVERHIEIHLVVRPDMTVADAHALGHEIEAAIGDRWPAARTTVHIEPVRGAAGGVAVGWPKVRTEDASPDAREFIHKPGAGG